ncbi:MAG: hypothetical protein EOO20_26650, partial [Chryseobacterium sp.]
MGYTYERVHEAYIKLKTNIYYDSNNLFMREQLAIFETDPPDYFEFFGLKSTTKMNKAELIEQISKDSG